MNRTAQTILFFEKSCFLMKENDYEYRLVERIISEMNSLLSPVHSFKCLNMSDVNELENAVNILESALKKLENK